MKTPINSADTLNITLEALDAFSASGVIDIITIVTKIATNVATIATHTPKCSCRYKEIIYF